MEFLQTKGSDFADRKLIEAAGAWGRVHEDRLACLESRDSSAKPTSLAQSMPRGSGMVTRVSVKQRGQRFYSGESGRNG